MNLVQEVRKKVHELHLLPVNNLVIVGVSGGPDSVALLHIFHTLKYELGLQLHVAHFNHGLRKSADTDEKFVERLAKKWHLPYTSKRWRHQPWRKRGSVEEIAREQRFAFLTHLAQKLGTNTIALGHTVDDLAETVLMRILRGTGLQGLRGMLPQRAMGRYRFIRPLLGIKKKDILEYLHKNKIPFRTDPTNQQTRFFRNKIRLELLPLLEQRYNPRIRNILSNLSENMATDYDYLEREAQKIFTKLFRRRANNNHLQLDLKLFTKQHEAIRRMLVRMAIAELHGNTNRLTLTHSKKIEDLLWHSPVGSVVDLPGRICVRKEEANLHLFVRNP